jgi:hypothetical protein
VVIADRLFKLAPQADFHTPEDRIATIYSFKVGDMVGFMMNERKEIVSLWLIQ